jgi:T-complex protein 1 subunit eta
LTHLTPAQVGDGTTSVVLLAGEILKECKQFIEEGVHSQIVGRGIRKATALCLERISQIAVSISFVPCLSVCLSFFLSCLLFLSVFFPPPIFLTACSRDDPKQQRELLEKCAATTLSSKLLAHQKHFFAKLVVDAVSDLGELYVFEKFDCHVLWRSGCR